MAIRSVNINNNGRINWVMLFRLELIKCQQQASPFLLSQQNVYLVKIWEELINLMTNLHDSCHVSLVTKEEREMQMAESAWHNEIKQ